MVSSQSSIRFCPRSMQTVATEPFAGAESPAINASFMWDRAEHRRLVRRIAVHAKKSKWIRYGWFGIALMWAVIVLLAASTGDLSSLKGMIPWVLVVAFWMVLFRYGAPWLNARSYPKQHPCVTSPFRVALDGDGVH